MVAIGIIRWKYVVSISNSIYRRYTVATVQNEWRKEKA